MRKRILRFVALLSLAAAAVGASGCWAWHRPVEIEVRHDRGHERHEEQREDHRGDHR